MDLYTSEDFTITLSFLIWSQYSHVISFKGVPKAKRGEIWRFLAKQHDFHSPPQEDQLWKEKSYEEIKEGVSSHQHSIFIDLGKST